MGRKGAECYQGFSKAFTICGMGALWLSWCILYCLGGFVEVVQLSPGLEHRATLVHPLFLKQHQSWPVSGHTGSNEYSYISPGSLIYMYIYIYIGKSCICIYTHTYIYIYI